MLVLTRRLGEKVYIGDDISLIILEIDRGKVRIGFDAPNDTTIMRSELVDRKPVDSNDSPDKDSR